MREKSKLRPRRIVELKPAVINKTTRLIELVIDIIPIRTVEELTNPFELAFEASIIKQNAESRCEDASIDVGDDMCFSSDGSACPGCIKVWGAEKSYVLYKKDLFLLHYKPHPSINGGARTTLIQMLGRRKEVVMQYLDLTLVNLY